jgi:spore coat protein CotH
MKRVVIVFILSLSLGLLVSVSCDSGNGSNNNNTGTSSNTGTGTSSTTGTGGSGGSPEYSVVYQDNAVDMYHIIIPEANWQFLVADPGRKEYVSATFVFYNNGTEERYENVGVRFKGNSSLFASGEKKSFKIHFNEYNEEIRFHGLKKINLNNNFKDPTQMRERIGYNLFRNAGCPGSRTCHVRLYLTITGSLDNEYWGIYTSVEQVNKTYLKERFGDDSGNLYKAQDHSDLCWRGWNQRDYEKAYELKTNEIENNYANFISFINVLNNTPEADFKAKIEKVFNVEPFLDWLAVNTILSNLDSYAGSTRNYYVYDNPATGKFEFIPWDVNEVFGNFRMGMSTDDMLHYDIYNPHLSSPNRPLVSRILNVPEFKASYETRMQSIIDNYFTESKINTEIDTIANLIRNAVYDDTRKDYTNQEFEDNIEHDVDIHKPGPGGGLIMGLKSFIQPRRNSIISQLP